MNNNVIRFAFASIFFILIAKITLGDKVEEKFLCTKSNNVNFRNGPGVQFEVLYKILAVKYPLKVIDKADAWYAVEDFMGAKMWVSSVNVYSKCGGIVKNEKKASVRVSPSEDALTLFTLESGFIINNIECYDVWCKVEVENKFGWVMKESLWGV